MNRGDKPITKEQAIEFCRERKQMHLNGAENTLKSGNESAIDLVKYNSQIDLANIYGDIADMLENKML